MKYIFYQMSKNLIDGNMISYKLKPWKTNSILVSDVSSGGKSAWPKNFVSVRAIN